MPALGDVRRQGARDDPPRQRPTYDEMAGVLVAQLQDRGVRRSARRMRRCWAEVATLRAEVARLRGDDDAAPGGAGPDAAAPPPPRTRPPAWVKANVIVRERHRPRQPRVPVPGRRREVPDRIIVHAPTACPVCAAPAGAGAAGGTAPSDRSAPGAGRGHGAPGAGADVPALWDAQRGTMSDLSEQVGGQRRVAWPVVAWVATRRTTLRLPLAQGLVAVAPGARLGAAAVGGRVE